MASKTITYYDAVQEILKRVNDADGDIYLDRAKSLVYEGITALATSEGITPDDIRGILKSETINVKEYSPSHQLQVKGESSDLLENPSKIIGIVDNLADDETTFKYIEISIPERNRLNDIDYKPFEDEIFYYTRGDYIYFYPKEQMSSQKFIITYLSEPNDYVYSEIEEDASSLEELFSLTFIYKVIDYSVSRIKQQQSGE
tara:strand:+ start:258 stop:860 length:603 start_codon:yes stop_codon:yes gene_type:complete